MESRLFRLQSIWPIWRKKSRSGGAKHGTSGKCYRTLMTGRLILKFVFFRHRYKILRAA